MLLATRWSSDLPPVHSVSEDARGAFNPPAAFGFSVGRWSKVFHGGLYVTKRQDRMCLMRQRQDWGGHANESPLALAAAATHVARAEKKNKALHAHDPFSTVSAVGIVDPNCKQRPFVIQLCSVRSPDPIPAGSNRPAPARAAALVRGPVNARSFRPIAGSDDQIIGRRDETAGNVSGFTLYRDHGEALEAVASLPCRIGNM